MMNNMPPYGMFPPMTGPNNMPWQDNNPRMNERINNLENQVNRIERQLRRMDQRLNQIENSMITPTFQSKYRVWKQWKQIYDVEGNLFFCYDRKRK